MHLKGLEKVVSRLEVVKQSDHIWMLGTLIDSDKLAVLLHLENV